MICPECGFDYDRVDPSVVAGRLGPAVAEMATGLYSIPGDLTGEAFGRVDPAAWSRPLVYHWPETRVLDIRWLAAHTAHEVEHHLADFRRGLDPGALYGPEPGTDKL